MKLKEKCKAVFEAGMAALEDQSEDEDMDQDGQEEDEDQE